MTPPPAWAGDTALVFVSLFVQGIPFLLAGALLGGLLTVYAPVTALAALWPKAKAPAALLGAALSFLFPTCDCAVVPVVRRLLQRGFPVPAGLAYLLAAPSLNPICLVSTWLAYQNNNPWFMVGGRAGGTLVLAVLAALILAQFPAGKLLVGEALLPGSGGVGKRDLLRVNPRLPTGLQKPAIVLAVALNDFLNVSVLYLIGSIGTCLLQAAYPLGASMVKAGEWALPGAMGLAFVLSLCSAADAFIANSFTGLAAGIQLAFLWLGPVYNLRMLVVYRGVLQTRAILGLGLILVLLIFLLTRAILLTG